jgi:Zn-dependent peptidase ImmA (M78 family)
MLESWRRVVQRLSDGAEQLTRPHAEPLYVTGTPKAGLMFGAVAPNISEGDVESLTAFLLSLPPRPASSGADADAWVDLESGIDPRSAPWRQGYDLAEAFLDDIAVDRTSVIDLDSLLQRLDVAVTETALEDRSIRGLAAAGPEHGPAIAINPSYPFHDRDEVQRFTKGHELCHVLFDRTAARQLAEASGPWAPVEVEQRANAFAAMLLMPEPLVRSEFGALADRVTNVRQLTEIAERLGVSIRALAWHAANLGLVSRAVAQQAAVNVQPGSETAASPPA